MLISPSLNVSFTDEHTCSAPDYEIVTLQNELNIFCVVYHPPQGGAVNLFSVIDRFLYSVNVNKFLSCYGMHIVL